MTKGLSAWRSEALGGRGQRKGQRKMDGEDLEESRVLRSNWIKQGTNKALKGS